VSRGFKFLPGNKRRVFILDFALEALHQAASSGYGACMAQRKRRFSDLGSAFAQPDELWPIFWRRRHGAVPAIAFGCVPMPWRSSYNTYDAGTVAPRVER
jgi:hypothetical protein